MKLKHVDINTQAKRNFFGRKTEFWDFIENLEKINPSAVNIITNIRSLSGIKTSNARGRAFIR